MKKMLAMVAVVAVVTVCAGWDQVKRSIYELQVQTLTVDGTINGVPVATALPAGATFAQADTNTTTTTTSYTPAFVGQVLVGGAGTGTNGVWVANGVTTNSWVQVH
jgi:hypothetical protein